MANGHNDSGDSSKSIHALQVKEKDDAIVITLTPADIKRGAKLVAEIRDILKAKRVTRNKMDEIPTHIVLDLSGIDYESIQSGQIHAEPVQRKISDLGLILWDARKDTASAAPEKLDFGKILTGLRKIIKDDNAKLTIVAKEGSSLREMLQETRMDRVFDVKPSVKDATAVEISGKY